MKSVKTHFHTVQALNLKTLESADLHPTNAMKIIDEAVMLQTVTSLPSSARFMTAKDLPKMKEWLRRIGSPKTKEVTFLRHQYDDLLLQLTIHEDYSCTLHFVGPERSVHLVPWPFALPKTFVIGDHKIHLAPGVDKPVFTVDGSSKSFALLRPRHANKDPEISRAMRAAYLTTLKRELESIVDAFQSGPPLQESVDGGDRWVLNILSGKTIAPCVIRRTPFDLPDSKISRYVEILGRYMTFLHPQMTSMDGHIYGRTISTRGVISPIAVKVEINNIPNKEISLAFAALLNSDDTFIPVEKQFSQRGDYSGVLTRLNSFSPGQCSAHQVIEAASYFGPLFKKHTPQKDTLITHT